MCKFFVSMGLMLASVACPASFALAGDNLTSGNASEISQNQYDAWPSFVPANASVKVRQGYASHKVAYGVARDLIDNLGYTARIHKEGNLYVVYAWK